MQPPRRRAPRLNLGSAESVREMILSGTAILMTVLLVRLAILIVRAPNETSFSHYVLLITRPIIWPFKQLPILGNPVGRDVLVADLALIPAVFLVGLLAAGIVAGWKDASSTPSANDPRGV